MGAPARAGPVSTPGSRGWLPFQVDWDGEDFDAVDCDASGRAARLNTNGNTPNEPSSEMTFLKFIGSSHYFPGYPTFAFRLTVK